MCSTAPMSVFSCNKGHRFPIVQKSEQNEALEKGEVADISAIRINPAQNNETSSVFYDPRVQKFVNYIMKEGNKKRARLLLEKGFENIKRIQVERWNTASESEKPDIETNPVAIFHLAVENCRPILKLIPVKRGGVTYRVPVPVTERESYFRSMKWIIEAANEKEKPVHFPEKIAWELLDAAGNTGKVVKRKQELHRQCEANRAYAHYRWT